MKFFMSRLTPEETKIVYPFLKAKAENIALRVTNRGTYQIVYKRRGKLFNMTIGKPEPIKGEIVIAIFEGYTVYLIFTLNRGVIRGNPYIVGKSEILSVWEFE